MGKLVVLTLGDGDFEQRGFPVTLQIGEEGESPSTQDIGHLPPNLEILEFYKSWQSTYRAYIGVKFRLEKKVTQTINFSIDEVKAKAENLSQSLNQWLKSAYFSQLREVIIAKLHSNDDLRLIIQTSNIDLRQLPWHLWDLLERYPKAEIGLSIPKYEQITLVKAVHTQVNILAILGDSEGINVEKDRSLLASIPNAKVHFLVKPERKEINDHLWEQPCDILFFAGHSCTEGKTGRIYINDSQSLTIQELKYALKKAIAQGLQLAIFNSCDGLGLAQELEYLRIPQIIVMREPVPDKVAQEFLKHFLNLFSSGKSLYASVREARERLQPLEIEFPSATWLPVICQNPAQEPVTWQVLRGQTERRTREWYWPSITNKTIFTKKQFWITLVSVVAVIIVFTFFSQRPQIAEQFYQSGINKAKRKDYSGAIEDYRQALSFDPNIAIRVNQELVKAYLDKVDKVIALKNKKDYDYWGAITYLEEAKSFITNSYLQDKVNAYFSEVYYHKGRQELYNSKSLHQAIESFGKSLDYAYQVRGGIGIQIKFNKQDKSILIIRVADWLSVANSDIKVGDKIVTINGESLINLNLDSAEENVQDLLRGKEGTQVILGLFREGKGNFNLSLTREYLVKLDSLYFDRGNAYREIRNVKEAIADYTKCIKLFPKADNAFFQRGSIYFDIGAYQRAIEDYNQAIELYPKYPEAYEKRGQAQIWLGDRQAALKDLQQAASLYLEQGKTDDSEKAKELIKKLQQ